jgi:acyl-CoA hydrolase
MVFVVLKTMMMNEDDEVDEDEVQFVEQLVDKDEVIDHMLLLQVQIYVLNELFIQILH